jgi:parallel beta-helix repeat protein
MRIEESDQIINLRGETLKEDILVTGPVENIIIRNGTIKGEIRLRPANASSLRDKYNRTPEWTDRVRKASPRNIKIRNVIFETGGSTHQLYVGMGSMRVSVESCKFRGVSTGPSLYLSPEGGEHEIRDCTFEAVLGVLREVISIDGSAYNLITNNRFLRCKNGGIYIYRNCGEDGTIRHQEPRFNLIKNNFFDLSGMNIVRPGLGPLIPEIPHGVIIGSRQGNRRYCNLDAGFPYGSSIDDRDFARNNSVINNTFAGEWFSRHVLDNDKNNTIHGNRRV